MNLQFYIEPPRPTHPSAVATIFDGDERLRLHALEGKRPTSSDARVRVRRITGPNVQAVREAVADYLAGSPQASHPVLKTAGHAIAKRAKRVDPLVEQARALRRAARELEAEAKGEKTSHGWVYLLGEEDYDDFVKIGKSYTHPKYRLANLQTGNARKLYVIAALKTKDRHALERKLHNKFIGLNELQEWFKKDSAILEAFSA